MSKTIRTILSHPPISDYHGDRFIDKVDDTLSKRRGRRWWKPTKMKKYTKSSLDYKERPFDVRGWGEYRNRTGPTAKLRRDRINRSYKKGLRQQYKKEIRMSLTHL